MRSSAEIYEGRALKAEAKGQTDKAAKLRAKAAKHPPKVCKDAAPQEFRDRYEIKVDAQMARVHTSRLMSTRGMVSNSQHLVIMDKETQRPVFEGSVLTVKQAYKVADKWIDRQYQAQQNHALYAEVIDAA